MAALPVRCSGGSYGHACKRSRSRVSMSSMDAEEMDEAMAQVRLRAALEAHIEETEEVPGEVGERVRALYPGRRING